MSDYMKSLHVRFRWEPELQKVRKELKRTYRETKAGYSRFRLGIGTAGHDPETRKLIYKNVLGRTQAETKAKLKAAI